MNWRELKTVVESQGVKDDTEVRLVEWAVGDTINVISIDYHGIPSAWVVGQPTPVEVTDIPEEEEE
jgi:hypothetical protein